MLTSISDNPYVNQLCELCGSKKRISKKWKEKIPTLTGKITIIEHTQIVCTNKVCQAGFDKNLLEENEKREAVRLKKEALATAAKKTNSKALAYKAKHKKS